jgi:uncharacterized membrane protein
MKTSDLVAGIALMVSGTVVYLQNWRSSDNSSRRKAWCGLGLVFVGAVIAFGEWLITLIFSGR